MSTFSRLAAHSLWLRLEEIWHGWSSWDPVKILTEVWDDHGCLWPGDSSVQAKLPDSLASAQGLPGGPQLPECRACCLPEGKDALPAPQGMSTGYLGLAPGCEAQERAGM